MNTVISTKDYKKYLIVEILFHNPNYISMENISKSIDCSQRSVINYLSEIRDEVSEVEGNLDITGFGVKLNLPPNVGLDFFKRILFKKSTSFQILEIIFFKKDVKVDDVVRELDISKSTISRIIKRLKVELTKFGIDIMIDKRIKIIGPEILVRRFYERYFFEAYSTNDWPFEIDRRKIVNEIIYENKDMSRGELLEKSIREAVNSTRDNYGYIIRDEEARDFIIRFGLEGLQDSKTSGVIRDMLLKYNKLCSSELSRTTDDKLGRIRLNNQVANTTYCKIYELTERMFSSLKNIYNLQENIRISTYHYIIELMYLNKIVPDQDNLLPVIVFKDCDYDMISSFDEESKEYSAVKDYIWSVCDVLSIKKTEEKIKDITYVICKHIEDIRVKHSNKHNNKKVLVYDPKNIINEDILSNFIGRNFELWSYVTTYIEEYELNEETLEKYQFDYLVSSETITIKFDEKPILAFYTSKMQR